MTPRPSPLRNALPLVVPLLCLVAGVLPWALTQGAVSVSWASLPMALWNDNDPAHLVLTALRLPRVLLAAVAGAVLAGAGTLTQGLFRNPLADPGLLGIASGAAAGASLAIVLGLASVLAPLACIGAWGATLLVYALGHVDGRLNVSRMLLAAIAVNALVGAWVGFLANTATDAQLRNVTFWMLGSFNGADAPSVMVVGAGLAVLAIGATWLCQPLNVLALGESEARHLGIAVTRVHRVVVVLVAVAVGLSVSAVGVIGFVGLVVPHALRLVSGPDYRRLFPQSLVWGALLMVVADVAARQWFAPAEVPVGIFTALVGAPFFLVLLVRGGRRAW